MPILKLAFDKSARRVDVDGRLHVERSHISKAAVNPYYGQEIPGWQALGLQADKIYKLLRDPVELERGAESFARIPVLSKHVPITVERIADDPELKQLIIGAVGSEVAFDAPYLDADLTFWDAQAIAGIERDIVRELSCGYRYVPVMESGEYEGEPYDGRMTEIIGNHLALVEVGRAGSDVVVADHDPFKQKETAMKMKMSKLGKALFASLCAASPTLAADAALSALVGNANRKTFDKKALCDKLIAMDADLDPQQLDNVIDALLDVEQSPTPTETPAAAADESPEAKIRSLLAGKVDDETIDAVIGCIPAVAANDEEPDESVSKEELETAMDSLSAKLRQQFKDAEQARVDVRATVGDVLGMDSAADIYGFALDHLKVDRKGVEGVAAMRALFKAASNNANPAPVQIAQDSAGLASRFPNAARFGR
jgi:hypothetical protein